MGENIEHQQMNIVEERPQERVYTQAEVEAIANQYKIQFEQLQRSANEEIAKRDLANFYQTLSILFEVVRNREAYSKEFIEKAVAAIEKSVSTVFEEEVKKTDE